MKKISLKENGLNITLCSDNGILKEVSLSLAVRACQQKKAGRNEKRVLGLIKKYLRCRKDDFIRLPLELSGYSEKEKKVLSRMRKIPFGKTLSYGELAERAGIPKGARFVGSVCAKNRFPLLIPCHRVVKSDGTLGGYSGGIKIKKKLLGFEGAV
jgi:methylated-DNA-[protein]-cysteine S-methyltransferase